MARTTDARSAYGHLKDQLNVRVSDEAHAVIRELAKYHGLTQAGVLEMVLREIARDRGMNLARITKQYQAEREVERRRK